MGRTGGREMNKRSRGQHCRFLNHEGRPTKSTTLAKAESQPTRIRDLCVRHAEFSTDVRPGELFATFHTPDVFLNHVISGRRDRFVGTPQYKVTAVRVEPI